MTPALATSAIVAAWFLIFVGLHVHGLRAGRGNARWLIQSFAGCLAGAMLTVVALLLWNDMRESILLSLIIVVLACSCLFVLYVPALYTVLTSVSVATLLVLRRNGGRLPEAQLYGHFATSSILEQRLAVLVENGHLVRQAQGGVALTRRGRGIARVFAGFKELWRLGPGG